MATKRLLSLTISNENINKRQAAGSVQARFEVNAALLLKVSIWDKYSPVTEGFNLR